MTLALPRRSFLGLAAAAVLLAAVAPARAYTPEVKDGAGLFSPDAEQRANQALRDLQKQFNKDLVIETYASIPADKKAEWEKNRAEFFNQWAAAIAREHRVDGIVVLIAKEPNGKLYLQTSVGVHTRERLFPLKDREKLNEIIGNRFRNRQYDEGLLEGIEYVRKVMQANSTTAAGAAGRPPATVPQPRGEAQPRRDAAERDNSGGWSWLLWVGLIVLGVWVLFAIIRGVVRAASGGAAGYPAPTGGYSGGYGPGYGPGWGGYGGGGGFWSGMLGGLFGAAAGNWMYDRFFRGSPTHGGYEPAPGYGPASMPDSASLPDEGRDFVGGGMEIGGPPDAGGGMEIDTGGVDVGGADVGGVDIGGGDFGGGDFGGGDFGGGGGDGGDWT
jgi:uncharacterized protein